MHAALGTHINKPVTGEFHLELASIPSKSSLMRSDDKALGWQILCTSEVAPRPSAGPPGVWAPFCLLELLPASLTSD